MNFKKEPFEDEYEVHEEIGKGHFAVVKRCLNKTTGTDYAGKFIRKKRVCRGVPIEDIEREIETLSRLEHPGIIKFHDVYDTGQTVVLLLELVAGGELFDFVSQRKHLSEEQTVHIVRQIIEAVSHMHSQNIAHLDLKPENVLLSEKSCEFPTVKVIDFGLSHRLDTVAEVKAMFGTPEFVAPEVVNFERLTLATDMWAIGVITYILLSGASPFLGDTVQETYANVSSASYKFDNIYFENVSEPAKDFIFRLLQKDPKKRETVFGCLSHPWMHHQGRENSILQVMRERGEEEVHVTCLAHAIHRVAEALREQSPSVNKLISSGKKIFVKAPSRVRAFKVAHPELPLPPEPILTRWGTWVSAALYYAEHLEAVKTVVECFDESDRQSIAKAKKSKANSDTIATLALIKAHVASIPLLILKLEAYGKELVQVVSEIEKFQKEATKWPGKIGKAVQTKLEFVLGHNPDWRTVTDFARVIKGDVPETKLSYTPQELASFRFLPMDSVDVERSFSRLKLILADSRHCLKTENIEKKLGCASNLEYCQSCRHTLILRESATYVTEIMPPPVTLLSAIKDGNMSSFEDILNSGHVDINQTNKHGETGLHLAASTGQIEMARLLLMCGANVSISDVQGDTPLIHAVRHSNLDIAKLLIKSGACISVQNQEGDTALHVAAAWGERSIVEVLIENGALLHIPNHIGQHPLHVAISRRHSSVAVALLNSGTDFDIHDSDGNAPIHLAVREGMISVTQALCSLGCNLDSPNDQGLYPIHIAARLGHIDIIRILCLAGCNTEARNADGIKAEITALKYGFNEISDLLGKVKSNYIRDMYIKQILPNGQPLPRVNLQIFGHSGVGKSTLMESLRTGYISGLFKRTKSTTFNNHYSPLLGTLSQPNSPSRTQIELDTTSRQNSLNFDLYNHQTTKGIDVQQAWISGVGYVTLWDFSGQDTYFQFYHHITTTSGNHSIILLVFSLKDSPTIQYKQCCFWLTFLGARIPPTEPIGNFGRTANMPRVVLVATHADVVRAPKLSTGDFNSPHALALTKKLRQEFASYFEIHHTPIVIDAHVPNSCGLKLLKTVVSDLKTSMLQGTRQMTGFCEAVVQWLPTLRKSAESVPVMSWEAFIDEARVQVNPLANHDHFSILFTQLEQMGEVILIGDLIVLSPSWLCSQVLGQLLSVDFIAHARITGCYPVDDFQVAFPEADAMAMLEVLEALQLCIQCENDGELEYEFPCYNFVERIEGLWESTDKRYSEGVYGGVRLKSPPATTHLLHCIFPRLQIELRRTVLGYYDWQSDLYQWLGGSKMCFGAIESLITFEKDCDNGEESIDVKVRGPPGTGKNCFLFLEELLGIIDMVLLDVVPGLLIEKHLMSAYDLRTHVNPIYCYPPDTLMKASLENSGFDSELWNLLANMPESLIQLFSFDADEDVKNLVCNSYGVGIDMLSTLCAQRLCALLDPPDPHGRDWCMLAVQLGLTNKISTIENSQHSRTSALLHQYAQEPDSSVGALINKLNVLGRSDAASVLTRYAPLYKVNADVLSQSQLTPIESSSPER